MMDDEMIRLEKIGIGMIGMIRKRKRIAGWKGWKTSQRMGLINRGGAPTIRGW